MSHPIKLRRLLTSSEFDAVNDFESFKSLLESGVHPDAKTRARKGMLPRAPLWSLAISCGAQAFDLLLELGCAFEPVADGEGNLHGALSLALRTSPAMGGHAIAAIQAGKIPKASAVADPIFCWNAFGEAVAKLCITRKIAEATAERGHAEQSESVRKQFGHEHFGPINDFIAKMRSLHFRISALAGPCCPAELLALSTARIHLGLMLHIENREGLENHAQSICDARLSDELNAREKLMRGEDFAFASMAGKLLAPFSPKADLAADANSADAVGAAFAMACGAQAQNASIPPLIALVDSTASLMTNPRSYLMALAPIMRLQQGAGNSEARAEIECLNIFLAHGCRCSDKDARGDLRAALRRLNEAMEANASLLPSGLGKIFAALGLAQKLGIQEEKPLLEELDQSLRRAIEREDLEMASTNPVSIPHPSRSASL